MIYLTTDDFVKHISLNILDQITEGNYDLLDNAELQAIGIIKDMIGGSYDIDAELLLTGNDRHQPLVLWMLCLATYQLYRIIPDSEVPDRTIKDYDDTMETLRQIGRGKYPTNVTPKNNTDGTTKRVFRMRSNTPRNHNML